MINSKVFNILRKFDKKEFREFGKLVESPYFNDNKKLIELYKIMKKYYPDFSQRNFTKEKLYLKLFPGREYNDGTIRKILSGMQNLTEEYLAHSAFDKTNLFQKKLTLLYAFENKKLDRLFEINFKELNLIYKKLENLDDDYLRNNFELEVAGLNFNLGKGRAGFEPKQVLDNLLRCTTYFICYSLITLFKLNQDTIVTSISYDFDYKNTIAYRFIESLGPAEFIESLKTLSPRFYNVIAIYFNRFMICSGQDSDDTYYNSLKELILKNIGLFSGFEKYNLMLFLENSCDEKILAGKDFRTELFNIHRKMLSEGLYKSEIKDLFPIIGFRKIILNALAIDEFEWTEGFVKKYLGKLPVSYKNAMFYYAQAMINFRKRKFESALENISKVKFEIYSFKFDSWGLKLKTEFELGYYQEALYSLDSYKHSINTDKISPAWMKLRFLNFMNYFGRILRKRINDAAFSKTELENLLNEITGLKEISEKNWLLEKINI